MDLEMAEEYAELRRATRAFVASAAPLRSTRLALGRDCSVDRDQWRRFAEQGWLGMLAPTEHGGAGGGVDALCALAVVIEEVGRELVPGPMMATNVAVAAIARGAPAPRERYLAPVVSGELVIAWGMPEVHRLLARPKVTARQDGPGFLLEGTCLVHDATVADAVLVTAATADGDAVLVVPLALAGVGVTPLRGLDLLRPYAQVRFHDVSVGSDSLVARNEPHAPFADFDLAVILLCAEAVGALDRALETTLEYAKDRKAFGRPIGSFQVLKHRLTDMNVWLETGKALTTRAIMALAVGDEAAEHASVAKAYLSQKGPMIVRDCLQIHGGIGFTWEHDIHLYLRRLESSAVMLGDALWHQDRLFSILDRRHAGQVVG